jgi:hypothetical protein
MGFLDALGLGGGLSSISGDPTRVPFIFTSTKRMMENGIDMSNLTDDMSATAALSSSELANAANGNSSSKGDMSLTDALADVGGAALHAASFGLLGSEIKPDTKGAPPHYVTMAVNPTSVQFQQPKRIVKRDTRNGSVFFHFTDEAGSNNDVLTCTFSGTTGYINLKSELSGGDDTNSIRKLRMWHELFAMSHEPMLFVKDSVVYRNLFFATFMTKMFPVGITLIGHFNETLSFEESANNPNQVQYRFGFTASKTTPSMGDIATLISAQLEPYDVIDQTLSSTGLISALGV